MEDRASETKEVRDAKDATQKEFIRLIKQIRDFNENPDKYANTPPHLVGR
jgi:hypothetical protein